MLRAGQAIDGGGSRFFLLEPGGLAANRKNLERFMMYSRDQGLIRGDFAVDDLFAASTRDT